MLAILVCKNVQYLHSQTLHLGYYLSYFFQHKFSSCRYVNCKSLSRELFLIRLVTSATIIRSVTFDILVFKSCKTPMNFGGGFLHQPLKKEVESKIQRHFIMLNNKQPLIGIIMCFYFLIQLPFRGQGRNPHQKFSWVFGRFEDTKMFFRNSLTFSQKKCLSR